MQTAHTIEEPVMYTMDAIEASRTTVPEEQRILVALAIRYIKEARLSTNTPEPVAYGALYADYLHNFIDVQPTRSYTQQPQPYNAFTLRDALQYLNALPPTNHAHCATFALYAFLYGYHTLKERRTLDPALEPLAHTLRDMRVKPLAPHTPDNAPLIVLPVRTLLILEELRVLRQLPFKEFIHHMDASIKEAETQYKKESHTRTHYQRFHQLTAIAYASLHTTPDAPQQTEIQSILQEWRDREGEPSHFNNLLHHHDLYRMYDHDSSVFFTWLQLIVHTAGVDENGLIQLHLEA